MEESYINVNIKHLEMEARAVTLHSGDIWQCLETSLVVTTRGGWGAVGIMGWSLGDCWTPCNVQDTSQQRAIQPKMSIMPRFLDLEPEDAEKQILRK